MAGGLPLLPRRGHKNGSAGPRGALTDRIFPALIGSEGGDTMAKGQEKPVKTNKPKLSTKEKQAKKKEKQAKKEGK
jgi:hypothetical protein